MSLNSSKKSDKPTKKQQSFDSTFHSLRQHHNIPKNSIQTAGLSGQPKNEPPRTRVAPSLHHSHPPPHPPPATPASSGCERLQERKMRHSRRLSNHPNQPQGPFCTNCRVNLSTFPAYITCADPVCDNIPVCVDCFSVGAAHTPPHKPNHPYRVVEKLEQPVYTPDWAAHEELRLVDALLEHGPHHWKAVADYVGKTQRKCELHYENVYLKSLNSPFASSSLDDSTPAISPNVSTDPIDEPEPINAKPGTDPHHAGNERKLKNNESNTESGTLDGFMPLRGDFDVEWDDKAEELVSDLAIDPDDTPEERELKTKLLLMYDQRLQRRNVVKEFLFDRKLLDFADLKYNDRRGTRDEKELSARLQIFSRLLSKPEFDAFYSSVMTEYRISRDVYRMSQARKTGIRKKNELDIYEVERKARCQRLGEQSKPCGKDSGVQKRRRSSTAVEEPVPPPTPLNSVPNTPGSIVLSPPKPTPPEDDDIAEGQNEPKSVQIRKARERKRIAKSPYPVLEAMPVDDAEDTWKLSQTEQKLCSALQIPPAEFLRMRDAMLYTASQNVKRRGRPRRRSSKPQVLTIRSRSQRQSKGITKNNGKQFAAKPPEQTLILDTIPLSSSHQQRLTLRQTSETPAVDSIPRVTLTCKPPSNISGAPMPPEPETSAVRQADAANENLRLCMKVAPPEAEKLSNSASAPTPIAPATAVDLLDSEDLPLSAPYAVPTEQQKGKLPPSVQEDMPESKEEDANTKECVNSNAKEDDMEDPKEDDRREPKEDDRADSKEDTRDGTPDSEISCEEDIVHVTALDRPRPMTRSFARLSKEMQDNVRTNLTRISRSNFSFEGPKRAERSSGPNRTVLNITTLKVRRPITRSYAAQIHAIVENSDSLTYTPTSESMDGEGEDLDAATEPRVEAVRTERSKKYRVPRRRSQYGRCNDSVSDVEDDEALNEESQIVRLSNAQNSVFKSSRSVEDDVSSRDEVDEVLCGEDGAGDWSADATEPRQTESRIGSQATNRKSSPEVVSRDLGNEGPDRRCRNVSDAEELLDQGRASVDSTLGRTSQRLAKKQPSTPVRNSQEVPGKEPAIGKRIPTRLAKKKPRHLTETNSPQKRKRTASPKRAFVLKPGYRESKETEVTIDGDGNCEGKADVQPADGKFKKSSDADSVEILSGGEGDYSESLGKTADEVEEVTLDEGQDDGVEDVGDATWMPHESDLGDEPRDHSDRDDQLDDVSLENPTCQTEVGTEPGTPDTSLQDAEFQQFVNSKEMSDDRRRTRGRTHTREASPAVRKSGRVQKRSRRLTESVEAAARQAKRRRTGERGNRTRDASESPEKIPGPCTVITGEVGSASLDHTEQIEAELDNVSKRFTPSVPRAKRKTSRQSTPSKSRYPTTERRITRSAGRRTRSRSALNNLRNRSITDRLSLRRG